MHRKHLIMTAATAALFFTAGVSAKPQLTTDMAHNVNFADYKTFNFVRTHPQGGIIEMTKPIWVSKVGIVDATSKKPVRIGYKLEDDKKTRVYKDTGKEIK